MLSKLPSAWQIELRRKLGHRRAHGRKLRRREKNCETERLKMVPVVNPSLQRGNLSSREKRNAPNRGGGGGVHYTRIFPRSHSMGTKRQLLKRIFIDGCRHRRSNGRGARGARGARGSRRRRRRRRGSYCRLRARWRCLSESIWIYDVFLLRRLGRTFLKRHLARKHYATIYNPSSGARAFRRGLRQR